MKVALVRVYDWEVAINYGDDYERFRSFDGLSFEDVTEDEFSEYREAVTMFNKRAKAYKLCLVTQATEEDKVNSFASLRAYRDDIRRKEAELEKERAAKAAAQN